MAISMTASAGPGSDRAVVFACDGKYLRYALMAADQIARLHPDRDFDLCVASHGACLGVPESLARHRIRSCGIETDGAFRGLDLDARRSEAVYLRLALPAAFAGQYRRLLYLDSDVFVQGGSFSAAMALDLGGHAIGAVRDNIQWRAPDRRPEPFRRVGLASARYFNSGMMLIDVGAFGADGLLERCLAFAQAHAGRLRGHDQDLLNCVLHGRWAELAPTWNWQYTRASMLFEAMERANVVHFIGAKKPWSHSGGALPLRFRRAYRTFLEAHFAGDPGIGADGEAPHRNRRYLRGMLARHLMTVGRMADYLDRFETDLTVIP